MGGMGAERDKMGKMEGFFFKKRSTPDEMRVSMGWSNKLRRSLSSLCQVEQIGLQAAELIMPPGINNYTV